MAVYVVTSGVYDDYHIEAIYTQKELAEEHIENSKADPFNQLTIETWETDQPIPAWTRVIEVEMQSDGKVIKARQRGFRSDESHRYGFYSFVPWQKTSDGQPSMEWRVITDDEEHAVEVVNEKRSQIIANGLWGKSKEVETFFKNESIVV